MKQTLTILLGAALLSAGCKKESVIYYKVHNVSLAPITLKVDQRGKAGTIEWYVPSGSEVTIANEMPGTKNVYNYKETSEYMSAFSKIEIYRDNTLKDKTDLRQKEYWIYFDNDKHSADYTLIVREDYL